MRKEILRIRPLASLWGNPPAQELHARGADFAAVSALAPRLEATGVVVPGLPLETATQLRQDAAKSGLTAVLCRPLARGKGRRGEVSDVVLFGPVASLKKFAAGLEDADLAAALSQTLDNLFVSPKRIWRCRDRVLALGEKTLIMGILNATPDSFSGDGLAGSLEAGLRRAEAMIEAGADILDIGGESSRPGAEAVSAEEEIERVIPLIETICRAHEIPVSVDTTKAAVATEAIKAGAVIINDISALSFDPEMAAVAAESKAGVILMHMLGTPRDMQKDPAYADLMAEIYAFLGARAEAAIAAGIDRDSVVIDPGFGFGKTVEHNLEILRRLRELRGLGYPVLIGTSRKSTIGKILGTEADARLEGTAATVALVIAAGADIVRLHDVAEMARVAKMSDAVLRVEHQPPDAEEYLPWGGQQ